MCERKLRVYTLYYIQVVHFLLYLFMHVFLFLVFVHLKYVHLFGQTGDNIENDTPKTKRNGDRKEQFMHRHTSNHFILLHSAYSFVCIYFTHSLQVNAVNYVQRKRKKKNNNSKNGKKKGQHLLHRGTTESNIEQLT